MKFSKTNGFLLVLAMAVPVVSFGAEKTEQGKSCFQTSEGEVTSFVKRDFLERLTRWDDEAKLLGTRTPEIKWDRIDRASSDSEAEKVLTVPFTAKGPDASRKYFALYECKEKRVEYSIK